MSEHLVARLRRSFLAALLVGSALAPLATGPAHRVAAAPVRDAAPPAGTDLYHLDSDTGHYIQGEGDHTRLELYNNPVGNPDFKRGWHLRDLRLVPSATSGKLTPADVHFGLQLAAASGGPALASLTNEDGVGLDIGLASLSGAQPAAVAGQVGDDAITYTMPAASRPSDVSLRATVSGVDARVVLHGPKEAGPFVFSLTPDARAGLVQDPSGVVRVTQAITDYLDDGVTPVVVTQTEFIAERPILRDSDTSAASVATGGPVTMTLSPGAAGPGQAGQLTLAVDPAWLRDPRRVFPVRLDLPIATGEAAGHSGTLGTVSSCAPDMPALRTDVVVGVEGGCTYHGLLFFDLLPLRYDTPIVSATLRLHTPDQTGPTGVQVYPNTSPLTDTVYRPRSWEQPSWNTAPAIAPGVNGIDQSASRGHEQVWDVTSLVRGWVSAPRTNAGLTLVGAGTLALFSSALGAGRGTPDAAPSLDIVYAPRPANPAFVDHPPHLASAQTQTVNPNLDAGAGSIYGVAGDFLPDYYATSGTPYPNCGSSACGGVTDETSVAFGQNLGGIGGSYVRIGASLQCTGGAVSPGYWDTSSANPTIQGTIKDLIYTAGREGLIPVINFLPPGVSCPSLSIRQWGYEAQNFVDYMHAYYPTNATLYFEVGNEENFHRNLYFYGLYNYVFGNVAQGLQSKLDGYQFSSYHILTSGMLEPTASNSCTDDAGNNNIGIAASAIGEAETGYGVSSAHLGVAVHPYHYNTSESGYWQNYYTQYGGANGHNGPAGPCSDLEAMYFLWLGQFPGMPLVFSEINWTDHPADHLPGCTRTNCNNCSDAAGCEGSYLVDLFTWLQDHGASAPNSLVRVLVYRGADKDVPLGIFGPSGQDKFVTVPNCLYNAVNGRHTLANDYYYLRTGACY